MVSLPANIEQENMWWKLFLLLYVFNCFHCHDEEKTLNYPGDLKLAAIFPIHKNEENGVCGEIQREDGIQPLEAMLFTLDEINKNEQLLPGIKLGAIAIDSCDNPIHAAEKVLPLLKCFMRKKVGLPDPILESK